MKKRTEEATKQQAPQRSPQPTPAQQAVSSAEPASKTGNAQKAKAVAIQVGKFVLDNLDKVPQDPYGILNVVFGVTGVIYEQVKLVQANKEQFTSLSERIAIIESMIRGLSQIPSVERYKTALDKFKTCVNESLSFIQEFSSKKWYAKIFCAGAYKEKFEDLNKNLEEVMRLLDFGIQVQSVFNHEQDKQDQEKDKADLTARMDEIVRLQQASMAQLQKLDLDGEERQKILLAQFESLRQQMQVVLAASSGEKTKDEIDQKFIVPFYDLAIDGMLRKGSFATIYLGKWCEQQVAIKKLEGMISPEDRQQFIREVQIMSELRSPFVVQFQGACLEENRLALVMEYMEQGALNEMLSKKKLTLEEQKQVALDLAKGLLFLHKNGIIHRDLKSANVLINSAGRAKITDFGLSKTKSSSVATICESSASFEWIAPEVLEKGKAACSPKSDMYSYGVILWEIVTGKKPYAGLSKRDIYEQTMSGRRLEEIKGIPEVYANIIRRCWSPNVQDRSELTEIISVIEQYNPAQLKAEDLYLQGQDYEGKKDYVHAKQVYEQAAQIGFSKAYTSLGLFCLTGKAGKADKKQAFALMLKGAESGHVRAQFNLAQMLEYGDGVDKDLFQAYEWYKKAVAQGHEESKGRLAHIEAKIREWQAKDKPVAKVAYQAQSSVTPPGM